MPALKRARVEPTEDWSKLQLRFNWPEQGGSEYALRHRRGILAVQPPLFELGATGSPQ